MVANGGCLRAFITQAKRKITRQTVRAGGGTEASPLVQVLERMLRPACISAEVVFAIFNANKQMCHRLQNGDGEPPLWTAIYYGTPITIIEALLAEWPEAVSVKFGGLQQTAVHGVATLGRRSMEDPNERDDVARRSAALELMRLLLAAGASDDADRNANVVCAMPDAYANLPLHIALEAGAPDELLLMLIHAHPAAVRAVRRRSIFSVIKKYCTPVCYNARANPDLLTALHIALQQQHQHKQKVSERVLLAMLEGCPEAAQVTLSDVESEEAYTMKLRAISGMEGLPLAFAIKHGAPVSVLNRLLDLHPEAAQRAPPGADASSRDPTSVDDTTMLHYALKHSTPAPFVRRLMSLNPAALQKRGGFRSWAGVSDWYPLHVALSNRCTPDALVMDILVAFPDATKEERYHPQSDRFKSWALHVGLEAGRSSPVLKAVLNANAFAATTPAYNAGYALHLALAIPKTMGRIRQGATVRLRPTIAVAKGGLAPGEVAIVYSKCPADVKVSLGDDDGDDIGRNHEWTRVAAAPSSDGDDDDDDDDDDGIDDGNDDSDGDGDGDGDDGSSGGSSSIGAISVAGTNEGAPFIMDESSVQIEVVLPGGTVRSELIAIGDLELSSTREELEVGIAEVVGLILHAFPPAAQTMENEKTDNFPLHIAMMNGAPASVVELLVTAHPEAIELRNYVGDTGEFEMDTQSPGASMTFTNVTGYTPLRPVENPP